MTDGADGSSRTAFSRLTLEDLENLSAKALHLIHTARDAAVQPNKSKILRRFSATECLQFLGDISIDTLYRRLKKDENLPQGVQVSARRREFTLEEVHLLQAAFGVTPRRPAGTPLAAGPSSRWRGTWDSPDQLWRSASRCSSASRPCST